MYGIVVYFEFGFGLRKIDRLVRYEAITLEEMRGYLPATQASKELDEDLTFRESQEQYPNGVLLWVWFTNVHKVAAYCEEAAAMDDADSDGEGDSKSVDHIVSTMAISAIKNSRIHRNNLTAKTSKARTQCCSQARQIESHALEREYHFFLLAPANRTQPPIDTLLSSQQATCDLFH